MSKINLIAGFVFKPYFNRVKQGEGGLVVFNFLTALFASRHFGTVFAETSLSFFVMCALYGYNDYNDRANDINNDKKEKAFSLSIIHNHQLFIAINVLLTFTTLLYAVIINEPTKAFLIAGVYLVNYLYSIRLKAIPFVDIIIVIAWGGLFTMIAGRFQWQLMCIAGIMTGIAHLFQMITDKVSDGENKVTTTVVARPYVANYMLLGLCVLLGSFLYLCLGVCWAVSSVLPFAVYFLSKQVTPSWYISRIYFAFCWVQLLIVFYGGL